MNRYRASATVHPQYKDSKFDHVAWINEALKRELVFKLVSDGVIGEQPVQIKLERDERIGIFSELVVTYEATIGYSRVVEDFAMYRLPAMPVLPYEVTPPKRTVAQRFSAWFNRAFPEVVYDGPRG